MTVIATRRLQLRPYKRSDAANITQMIGDLDVARWLTRVPYPYGLDDAEAFIQRMHDTDDLCCAITLDGALIGCVSHGDELGYWLGKPYWGHGFATEAASALVCHVMEQGAPCVWSGFILGNVASQRVLTKLGFRNEDIKEVTSAALGAPVRVQKMLLQAPDWQAQNRQAMS